MSTEPNLEIVEKQEEDAELAKQFTEIFLNKSETVGILLDLLEVCQLQIEISLFLDFVDNSIAKSPTYIKKGTL